MKRGDLYRVYLIVSRQVLIDSQMQMNLKKVRNGEYTPSACTNSEFRKGGNFIFLPGITYIQIMLYLRQEAVWGSMTVGII